jgi:hypothetical protein
MDDFVVSNLYEARNEWSVRLVSILTPLVIQGIRSIFEESWNLCLQNNETSKYLMCFQNLLSRVPKWNAVIIEEEVKRIIEKSGCHYLEDLITCVHIIVLKLLTSIRVGNRQKKIDISIPKLDNFVHKVYILVARKVYSNVYLFEKNISSLHVQKNNRELESIVQECILNAVRESIPTEAIIRAYLDESVEQEEEVIIESIDPEKEKEAGAGNESLDNDVSKTEEGADPEGASSSVKDETPEIVPSIKNIDEAPVVTRLTFNDFDSILDDSNNETKVEAPKTIEQLERISMERTVQRKLEEEQSGGYDDDSRDDKIKIFNDSGDVNLTDVNVLDEAMFDFEELP